MPFQIQIPQRYLLLMIGDSIYPTYIEIKSDLDSFLKDKRVFLNEIPCELDRSKLLLHHDKNHVDHGHEYDNEHDTFKFNEFHKQLLNEIIPRIIYHDLNETIVQCQDFNIYSEKQSSSIHQRFQFISHDKKLCCFHYKWVFKILPHRINSRNYEDDSHSTHQSIATSSCHHSVSLNQGLVLDEQIRKQEEHDIIQSFKEKQDENQIIKTKDIQIKNDDGSCNKKRKIRREIRMSIDEKKSLLEIIKKCHARDLKDMTPKKVVIKRKVSSLDHDLKKNASSSSSSSTASSTIASSNALSWWPFN